MYVSSSMIAYMCAHACGFVQRVVLFISAWCVNVHMHVYVSVSTFVHMLFYLCIF